MKHLLLMTLLSASSYSFAGDILSDALTKFTGEYRLTKDTSVKRYECRNHFTIREIPINPGYHSLSGGLKFKNKARHQQYVKGSVSTPGENLSTDPTKVSYKAVKTQPKFPFGKQTNVIFTRFDSKISDYGRMTYITDAKWGSYFEGYRVEKFSLTIDFTNQGLTVGFYKIGNKKKGKLGKKLATCNYAK